MGHNTSLKFRNGCKAHFSRERPPYFVAVWVVDEGCVVARRITFGGVAKPARAVIGPAGLHGGRVESIDLAAALGHQSDVLLHAVWVKAVNPENRAIDAVANSIGAVILGKLDNPAAAERVRTAS
jgi:hypothetical protein